MKRLSRLFLENKAWVSEKLQINPDYFKEISKDQNPDFLWIGCSDSRVNPSEITGTGLGEMFVHRNIANLVIPEDLNLMSVLTYGVEYLKIKHIIICGHQGCGGVAASLSNNSFGIIDKWLIHIKNVISKHSEDLAKISNEKEKINALVEINVREQIRVLSEIPLIADKLKKKEISLHGWVYELSKGTLKDLVTVI